MTSFALARPFRVLALESSADDTCAAVVDASRRIWSNVVCRQNRLHEKTSGIHPLVALRAHQRNMPGAVRKALHDAKLEMADIDGVAFTRGPGITGCLTVASNAAKTLAAANNKPIVGVHHMQAHALTAHLTSSSPPSFPFLTLLVSGGHTMIVLATSLVDFRVLATTVDRSVGSTIDRVVTLLQIKWADLGPGPGLERYCAEPVADEGALENEPPITMSGKLSFSYTGLHSWVERTIHAAGGLDNVKKRAVARAFQNAAFAHLEEKLLLALKWCRNNDHPVRHVVVSGGVASNSLLRQRLKTCLSQSIYDPVDLVFPDPLLCTDNAVMIAWASMHRFLARDYDDYSIETLPTWSLEDLKNPPDPPAVRGRNDQ
ncbi:Gcp-like domain-containing protein [Mycena pura]|uniref:N(6)-L-threonylcarbamoyladenine synthase n=1 Tax=Mycena pura TaxID=153505 RepID=A0AAD6VH46_9AGAR|nr:Gcp-like domain-containing protein [Mycena pura]